MVVVAATRSLLWLCRQACGGGSATTLVAGPRPRFAATKQCTKQAALEARNLLPATCKSKVGSLQATRLALLAAARAVHDQDTFVASILRAKHPVLRNTLAVRGNGVIAPQPRGLC